MKKIFLLGMLLVASTLGVCAQSIDYSDPRWANFGSTDEEKAENIKTLSYFDSAYKTKDYDFALELMHKLIANCPKASMNTYIRGGEIYRVKMARARTKDDRLLYLDSMLYLFDLRIENFPDHSKYGANYIKAQKAIVYIENNPSDLKTAYDLFRVAIKDAGYEVDPAICTQFFNSLTDSFKLDDITPEEYLMDFEFVVGALESGSVTDEDREAISIIENIFAGSGAASCENIETIFRPQYEADPENVELVQKILGMFQRSKCGTDFQLTLTEKLYSVEPTADLAAMLGGIYDEKGDISKAIEYYNVAVSMEQDPTRKYNILAMATGASIGDKMYRDAAEMARQMISLDENNGLGYMFLAGCYAGGASGCSGFDQQAAYWLVVDAYTRARAKYEGDEEQVANINRMIASYSANFPKVEDTFMRGLNPGDSYTVRCGWLSGTTTVREKK